MTILPAPPLSCNRTTAALLLQDHPSHALNTHPTLRRNHLEPLGNRKDPAAILGPGSWVLGAVESCKSVPGQCHTFKYESFEAFEIFESSQARGIIRIIIRYYTLLYDIIRGIPKNNPRRFRLERISSTTHGVLLAGARCPRKSVLVILATSKWKGCHVALCQDGR